MSKLSDADFNKVFARCQKTTIGAVLIQNYKPVKHPVMAPDGKPLLDDKGEHLGDPTEDNAFVISCRQYQAQGARAHTRIEIRGSDGLIHTSHECDHVFDEPTEQAAGKMLLHDIEATRPSTQPGAQPNEYETYTVFSRYVALTQDNVDLLLAKRIFKVPTGMRTADEIAKLLTPLLEQTHVIHGTKLEPFELAALGGLAKTRREQAAIDAKRLKK